VDELKTRLSARAKELGFARMGVARAEALDVEGARLFAWLNAGRHGEMSYMEETALATPYARAEPARGPAPGRVARYAQGRDYHNVLLKRARKLAEVLRAEGHNARTGVDSLPIFERAWAQRAGLGFIGKNCCLIVPGLGSHVFLTTLVTSAQLAPDAPMKERCGACTACLDGCPTRAFVGPRELDARRCISYLTIEQRGQIPEPLRAGMGDWLFGCDACQDVCPYNQRVHASTDATAPFAADARWDAHDAASLLTLSEEAFGEYAQGSPIKRAGRDGMARNAAVVLGNVGTRRQLPVLTHAARLHSDATVREAASWACTKIEERDEA
jgi:epoxyqueuosine reductase